ncbi:MAG: HAD family hydrolase [Planctomycetota bacterium]
MDMKRTHAFIFDLDGTLVDSLFDITHALNHALMKIGESTVRSRDVRSWIGDGLPTLCRRAVPKADKKTVRVLVREAVSHYTAHCAANTRPYPNVLQMLELLRATHTAAAVLSNKPHDLTLRLVSELNMGKYFSDIRGCTSEEDKKPSPHSALRFADALGVRPADVFLVGDSSVDIETARNADMIAVAVTWGFTDRSALLAAGPDFLLDDPAEIPQLPRKKK